MQGIVLSRRDFKEVDQVVTIYTKEKGKRELLARGVKKIVSKNAAHLEPFSIIHFETAAGKAIDYLTSVQPISTFVNIRSQANSTIAASRAVHLVNTLVQVEEPDTRIFDLLRSCLRYLNETSFQKVLLDGFALKFFDLLGFTPVLNYCVVCDKSAHDILAADLAQPEKENFQPGLYFMGGGLVCQDCRKKKVATGESIVVCDLKEVSNMELLLHGTWHVIASHTMEAREQAKLHHLIFEFAQYHSEKKLINWAA